MSNFINGIIFATITIFHFYFLQFVKINNDYIYGIRKTPSFSDYILIVDTKKTEIDILNKIINNVGVEFYKNNFNFILVSNINNKLEYLKGIENAK